METYRTATATAADYSPRRAATTQFTTHLNHSHPHLRPPSRATFTPPRPSNVKLPGGPNGGTGSGAGIGTGTTRHKRSASHPENIPPRSTTPVIDGNGGWTQTYEWVRLQDVEGGPGPSPKYKGRPVPGRSNSVPRPAGPGIRVSEMNQERDREAKRPGPGHGHSQSYSHIPAHGHGHGHWDEQAAIQIDMQARRWMAKEEESRRIAALRVHRDRDRDLGREDVELNFNRDHSRDRAMAEEIRRIQARIQQKRETERVRMMEERRRMHEDASERERWQRQAADKAVLGSWNAYESRWAEIMNPSPSSSPNSSHPSDQLTFRSIPFPMLIPPTSPLSITPGAIAFLLFSPLHSQGQSPKDRIKDALRRWHPDRFRRLMPRVVESDRAIVEESVGAVARCLNELLRKYGSGVPNGRMH